jgi:hypothetical protein
LLGFRNVFFVTCATIISRHSTVSNLTMLGQQISKLILGNLSTILQGQPEGKAATAPKIPIAPNSEILTAS